MPESATNAARSAPGARFAAKAAAGAAIAALGLFIAIYIAVSLPHRFGNSWRAALPSPAMNATEAAGALLQARYLHEAVVRPQLVKAGFASSGDVAVRALRAPALSRDITEALWTMRALPEVHDAMLAMLTDTALPTGERLTRLFQFGGLLDSAASAIAHGNKTGGMKRPALKAPSSPALRMHTRDWFLFFNNDPRLNLQNAGGNAASDDRALHSAYAEKLAFARRVLPQLLAEISRDVDTRLALVGMAGDGKGSGKTWDAASRDKYMANLGRTAADSVRALWLNRATPGFLSAVREFVASGAAPLAELYAAVPLLAEQPGLPAAEYIFWLRHKDDLAGFAAFMENAPANDAYPFFPGGALETAVRNALQANGTFPLEGHDGPGVALSRVETLAPGTNFSGNLYLLADTFRALPNAPAYDQSRAHCIFSGTVLQRLPYQPLVLPLDVSNAADRALINWYAAEGWRQGRVLLFSAEGSPAAVARHWGGLALAWWPTGDGKTVPARIRPQSGHFMRAVLPALHGAAVTRFFGPMTVLWFGNQTVDASGWVDALYSAEPEGKTPLARERKPLRSPLLDWARGETPAGATQRPETMAVVFSGEMTQAARQSLRHNQAVTLARLLDKPPHDAAMPPAAIYAFVDKAVSDLCRWGFLKETTTRQGVELLWHSRKNGKAETLVRASLSDTSRHPLDRLRNARRALGMPEQKGN